MLVCFECYFWGWIRERSLTQRQMRWRKVELLGAMKSLWAWRRMKLFHQTSTESPSYALNAPLVSQENICHSGWCLHRRWTTIHLEEITRCTTNNAWQVLIYPLICRTIKLLLYPCSCGRSWSPGGCHCPCPWWRTSCRCGCPWGLAILQTCAWGEWRSCSPDHRC